MTNLLFPTDFLTTNAAVLGWVRLLARKTGATVTLLHAYQPMIPDTTLPTIGDPGMGVMASQEIEDISRHNLSVMADELRAEGLSIQVDWRIGSVEDSILDAAHDHSADLIVMGRSDMNTFFDRLAGSSAADVAGDARCPVLIVPATSEGHAVRPAQVHLIAYAMQEQTTQALVTFQTESLAKVFDAQVAVLTEDQIKTTQADLIVMQLYPQSGFLDKLFHPNHTTALIGKSDVPVLVYHEQK